MEPLKNNSGEIYAVMAVTYDITEQVESRKKIEESDKALRVSQEALKINERKLQNVFHATSVAIGVLEGPEHKYTFVNPVTCQMLHRTKEELVGKTVKELFPEIEAHGIFQLYDEVYNTGKPFTINEMSVQMDILNDGVSRQNYFNLSCEPLRDNQDKIYAILVTAVDVTEQVSVNKKIEESEKQQAYMLKLSDAIRTLDNPLDIEHTVTKIALDFMDADWCHYATIEGNNLIIQQSASRGDLPSLAGVYLISSFALLKAVLNAGLPFIVNDVNTTGILDEELKQLCIQLQNI